MRRLKKDAKRVFSIVLAAAMVMTMIPQSAITAQASEKADVREISTQQEEETKQEVETADESGQTTEETASESEQDTEEQTTVPDGETQENTVETENSEEQTSTEEETTEENTSAEEETSTEEKLEFTFPEAEGLLEIRYVIGEGTEFTAYEKPVLIEEGETLRFYLSLEDGAQASVFDQDQELAPDDEGIYSVKKVNADTRIKISVQKPAEETFEVSVQQGEGVLEVTFAEGCVDEDSRITKDKDLLFQAEAEAGKRIANAAYIIGAGEEAKQAEMTEDGFYRIAKEEITDKVQIHVEAEEIVYQVCFEADGVKVFSEDGAEELQSIVSVPYGESLRFTVDSTEEKDISVSLSQDGAQLLAKDESGVYTFTPDPSNTQDGQAVIYVRQNEVQKYQVQVEYDAKAVKSIFYKNELGEYQEAIDGLLELHEGQETSLFIETQEQYIVKQVRNGEEPAEPVEEQISDEPKNVYPLGAVERESKITVETEAVTGSDGLVNEAAVTGNVSLVYNEDEVTVEARIGAKAVPDADIAAKSITVPQGKTLTVTVKALENCKVIGAETLISGTAKKATLKAGSFEVKVTDSQPVKITVQSEAVYTASFVKQGTADELVPVKNVYQLDYNGTYEVSLIKGVSAPAQLTGIEVYKGSKLLAEADGVTAALADGKAALTVTDKLQKQNLTVKLFAGDQKELAATVKVYVLPVLTKVSVAGLKKGVLTQDIDTKKTYKINLTPANADGSILYPEVTAAKENPTQAENDAAKALVQARIVDGMLEITTGKAAEKTENAAKVTLYTGTGEQKKDVAGGTFTVTLGQPAFTSKTPTASVKSSTDTEITLLVGLKGVTEPVQDKFYYEITAKPKLKSGEQLPDGASSETRLYVEKTDQDSQTVVIKVNSNEAGKGNACNYDIAVRVVSAKSASGSQAIEKSFESKAKNLKGATKNPYYEDKLTLTKKTTTLYTGQKNVLVAVPKFGKNTTYMDGVEAVVLDSTGGDVSGAFNPQVKEDGIYLDANFKYMHAGKYTLSVKAKTPDPNTNPSSVNLVINVVTGINEIVAYTADQIYKQDKKAASLKVSMYFNDGYTAYQPKSKKVSYEIVDPSHNPIKESSRLYGMVTVKNGTISVNKNYVVSSVEAENQFCVKVKGDDFKDNTAYDFTNVITITDQAQEIGGIYVAKYLYNKETGEEKFSVIPPDPYNDVFSTGELNESYLIAVKKGEMAGSGNTYSPEQLINPDSLTFSVSNKSALRIYEDGYIESTGKLANNVSFTVTTKDGGKKKAVLKFHIGYIYGDGLALYGLLGYDQEGNEVYGPFPENYGFYSDNSTNVVMDIDVALVSGGKYYSMADIGVSNYTLKVSGAKIVKSNKEMGQYSILFNSEKAVITLQDKNNNTKHTYNFINTRYQKDAAPRVSTKDKLRQVSLKADQQVTYTLNAKDAAKFAGKYVYVSVDAADYSKSFQNYLKYGSLIGAAQDIFEVHRISQDGTFTLNFDQYRTSADGETDNLIDAGTYKLCLTFGDVDGNKFVPSTKTSIINLKVDALGKTTYKAPASYNLPVSGTTPVALATKQAVNGEVNYRNGCKNAIIGGKANKFTEYFTVSNGSISLKPGVNSSEIDKNDCIGYVTYDLNNAKGEVIQTSTVKITIKFKNTGNGKASDPLSLETEDPNIIIEPQNSIVTPEAEAERQQFERMLEEFELEQKNQ